MKKQNKTNGRREEMKVASEKREALSALVRFNFVIDEEGDGRSGDVEGLEQYLQRSGWEKASENDEEFEDELSEFPGCVAIYFKRSIAIMITDDDGAMLADR